MHFPHHFYRLPFHFDAQALLDEINQFDESEWISHPQGFEGNAALILVSRLGEDNHDTHGKMEPCPRLSKMPYTQQVMASFNTVIGRARLMRLSPGRKVNRHTDISFYWRHRMRLHIPIVTDPRVQFMCEDKRVHMGAGEAWTFDNWRYHEVHNDSDITRVHLVIDTVGSLPLWQAIETQSWSPMGQENTPPNNVQSTYVPYDKGNPATLRYENFNVDTVLPPSDVDTIVQDFLNDLNTQTLGVENTDLVKQLLMQLQRGWRALWSEFGDSDEVKPQFAQLLADITDQLQGISPTPSLMLNDTVVVQGLRNQLGGTLAPSSNQSLQPGKHLQSIKKPVRPANEFFDTPIIIVSAPRTGSTLLYETLANNRMFWSVDGESHAQIEGIPSLNPANRQFHSNTLDANDASPEIIETLQDAFKNALTHPEKGNFQHISKANQPSSVRFLEKTPKNALRIPFIRKVFPQAKFIYLYRRADANISSIMDGWKSGRYVTYRNLPNWEGEHPWSYLLPPNWQSVSGKPLAEAAWLQYREANDAIRRDLSDISDQVYHLDYDDFIENKAKHIEQLCAFCDVPFGKKMQQLCEDALPLSRFTLDQPSKDKWKRNEAAMATILDDANAYYQDLITTPFK